METPSEIEFDLRRMSPGDIPQVLAIERQSFSNPWHEATFRGEIQNEGISFPVVAVDRASGAVVGYMMYWLIQDEVQINNVAVRADLRRKHIGERMLTRVLSEARARGGRYAVLEVRISNAAARRLYENKLGFVFLDIRTAYYTNPSEDALVLGLPL